MSTMMMMVMMITRATALEGRRGWTSRARTTMMMMRVRR